MSRVASGRGRGDGRQTREVLLAALADARAEQVATDEILLTINGANVNLESILEQLIRSAIALCGAARGVVWVKQDEKLVLGAHVGYPSEWVAHSHANPVSPGPDSHTVSGRVASTGAIYNVADLPDDLRFSAYGAHPLGDHRGCLAAPLVRDGGVVGVIVLTRPEPGLFSERQVDRLLRFANQAVIAIQNAQHFNQTQQALERQAATAEVLEVIASSPSNVLPVFDAIAASANRLLCGFSTTVIRFVGDALHLVAFTPTNPTADEALQAAFPRPIADFPPFLLVRDGETQQFIDTEAELGVPPVIRDLARLRGYRGMLFTPLMSNDAPSE